MGPSGEPSRHAAAPRPRTARGGSRPWIPGRATIVLASILAVAAAVVLAPAGLPPGPPTVWHRYPEVARVPAGDSALLREIPGWRNGDDPLDLTTGPRLQLVSTAQQSVERIESTLARMGPRARWALLRYLIERSESLERNSSRFRDPAFDVLAQAPAMALAKRSDPTTDAVLLRAVADRGLHVEVRTAAAIALARAGNVAAVDPLVDRVLDPDEDDSLRREVLLRLPRVGTPIPPRVREALYLPWFRLDVETAAVLAATGDPEAPTLVEKGLRRTLGDDARSRVEGEWLNRPALLGHLVEGAVRISGADPDVVDASARVRTVLERLQGRGSYTADDRDDRPFRDLVEAFGAWLAAHPEALGTEFERGRAAYRGSDLRARESATASIEDVLDRPDRDWDLAAALLLLVSHARGRDEELDALDRLASRLRPEVEAAPGPREKLAALSERLLSRRRSLPLGADPSDLRTALRYRAGNCLGSTALFLALGDRLGLPLYAVAVPDHVFVRWDDGAARINLEPTEGGAEISDEVYATKHGVDRRLPASGRSLRPLERREFLALALSNRAAVEIDRQGHGAALRFCDDALRLDPRCPGALLNRAVALAHLVLQRPGSDTVGAVADAERLLPLTPSDAIVLLRALLLAGVPDEAIALADRRRALGEQSAALEQAVAEGLLLAGRATQAAERTARLVADAPHSVDFAALEVDVSRALDPSSWRGTFDAAASRTGSAPELRLAVAERWARPGRPDDGRRHDEAAALLDEIASVGETIAWAKRLLTFESTKSPFPLERRHATRLLLVRATLLEGRGPDRNADELRRLVRGLMGLGYTVFTETVIGPTPR